MGRRRSHMREESLSGPERSWLVDHSHIRSLEVRVVEHLSIVRTRSRSQCSLGLAKVQRIPETDGAREDEEQEREDYTRRSEED
jgi:hypothetical protein